MLALVSPVGSDWHVEKTLACDPIIQYYTVANDTTIEQMAVLHPRHFVLLWLPSGHHHHHHCPHSAGNRNPTDAANAVNCYRCCRAVPDRRSRCWHPLHSILNSFRDPLWVSLGLFGLQMHIAGKLYFSVVTIKPLLRIVTRQTQQNPILQTNI
jgi:hypothetical protein